MMLDSRTLTLKIVGRMRSFTWKHALLAVAAIALPAIAAVGMHGDAPISAPVRSSAIQPSASPTASGKTPAIHAAAAPSPSAKSLVFPVEARDLDNVIGRFGDRRDGGRRTHLGIDIAAPRGTPVLAVANGVVDRVELHDRLGGRVVWLREAGSSRRHYFAHLQTIVVTRGQKVRAGQMLGTVGTTGNAVGTPPHLHYAVKIADDVLDPVSLFRSRDGDRVAVSEGRVLRTHLAGGALKARPGGRTIAVLPARQTVTVLGEEGRFYRVRYKGREGYLARWLLESAG
jgi:peptidoglycan LD-endopeptidase LytH